MACAAASTDQPAAVDPALMGPIGRGRPAVFAGIWLVYLVAPLLRALHHDDPWRWVGVGALVVFAGAFVAGSLLVRPVRSGERSAAWMWLLLAAMCGLLVAAVPAAGEPVTGGMIYIGVLAVMALPGRVSLVVVGLLATVSEIVPRLVPGWHADAFFAFQIMIACFAAWGVMQIIARNGDLLQARYEIARLAVADERARLSRDLHDILGHSLTVITVKAELAGRLAEVEGAPRARAEIADVERLAREALADVRSTVGGMRGVTLAAELAGARTALEAAGVRALVPSSVDEVPPAWRELFAWAVREGVTNVVRHAHASECVVRVGPRVVEVQDDGVGPPTADLDDAGFDPAEPAIGPDGGQGLAGLSERARRQGATMSVGRPAGVVDGRPGFLLRVEVPA